MFWKMDRVLNTVSNYLITWYLILIISGISWDYNIKISYINMYIAIFLLNMIGIYTSNLLAKWPFDVPSTITVHEMRRYTLNKHTQLSNMNVVCYILQLHSTVTFIVTFIIQLYEMFTELSKWNMNQVLNCHYSIRY